jgi:HD superfamily phosphodiesterase
MDNVGKVTDAMIQYYAGDVRRINHFLKVYGFAKAIGELEGLDKETQETLEIAALTHDIGIKNSEIKYKSTAGNYQQIEGPPVADKMLTDLHLEIKMIERVCWLIAHHHTYHDIKGEDYQILIEADFLVNAFEDHLSDEAIHNMKVKLFRTEAGLRFLNHMFMN